MRQPFIVFNFSRLTLLIALLLLPGCGGNRTDDTIVIRLGHVGMPGSHFDLGCQKFKELLEERVGGRVEVRIFATSQLGEDKEMLEGLRLGTLELHVPSSVLHSVEPMFGLFDLPFLIEDREQMERIAEGPIGDRLTAALMERDLVLLGFWENGFRNITNNIRPIVKPEDLQGIKLRTPKDPERVELFRILGANPTSMSFGEVFSALKQGVIDGQENPLSHIVSARIHEVQDYLSISRHVYSPAYPLMSRAYFDSLPESIQTTLKEVAVEVGKYHRRLGEEMDRSFLETLGEHFEISTIDREAFIEITNPMYEDFAERFGQELIDRARSGQGSS